jgi:hypothetical protein
MWRSCNKWRAVLAIAALAFLLRVALYLYRRYGDCGAAEDGKKDRKMQEKHFFFAQMTKKQYFCRLNADFRHETPVLHNIPRCAYEPKVALHGSWNTYAHNS